MAELEKAPTIPEGMVPKVLKALDAGLMPGTTEYHDALGSSARSRGLIPSADLPPIISSLRDRFSRETSSLYKEQQSLDAVGSEILKVLAHQEATLKAHQDFAARNAPPRSVLQQSYGQQAFPTPMVPGLSEPQPAYGPGAPMQAQGPGSPMPDPYWNDSPQLQQALLEQGQGRMEGPRPMVEGPQPMARNAVMTPDANAPLQPWEVGRMQRLQAGHTVMGENGQEIPTALARPHGDSLTAEQANQIQDDMKATWGAAGIPAEKQPKLGIYKPGSVISRAAFDTKMRETNDFLQKAGYQTTTKSLDDVSVSITGKLFSELNPDALVTAKDRQRASEHGVQLPARNDLTQREAVGLVKNYGLPILMAKAKAVAQQEAQLEVPDKPSPGERESLVEDVKTLQLLDDLNNLFDESLVGPLRGRLGAIGEELGFIGEDEADLRADVSNMKNGIINAITGAAMSEPEAKRIMRQIPDMNNPSTVFGSRLKISRRNALLLAHIRREVLEKSGIQTKNLPPLPPIPGEYKKEYDRMRGESLGLKSSEKSTKTKSTSVDEKLDLLLQELRKKPESKATP